MANDRHIQGGSPSAGPPRSVGLVLGAGGVAGWAWLIGCLAALEEAGGWDARQADLIVGTSAGAGVAAMLRGGRSATEQLARYQEGAAGRPDGGSAPAPAVPPLSDRIADGVVPASQANAARGPVGRVRRARPLAPQLVLLGLARWPPRPGLVLAGMLPRGNHALSDLGDRLGELHGDVWPEKPLWVTAVRADNGRRVVFGRDGGQPVDVASAVRASAGVPGWYEPVRIGGRDHLDGGAWSTTHADLVAGLGFDVALVLAPLSVATARMGRSTDRLRRAYHRSVLSREVDVVHRNGTDTVVIEPQADDLALLTRGAGDLDGPRRLAIAQRARQRIAERLADDPSLAAALRARTESTP